MDNKIKMLYYSSKLITYSKSNKDTKFINDYIKYIDRNNNKYSSFFSNYGNNYISDYYKYNNYNYDSFDEFDPNEN